MIGAFILKNDNKGDIVVFSLRYTRVSSKIDIKMNGFTQLNTLFSSEAIPEYPQKFPPLIIGNWDPYRSKKELDQFLEKLDPFGPIHLALPLTMLPKNTQKMIFGSNAMHDATPGSFTEDVATEVLNMASFVLFHPTPEKESYPSINLKIRALLKENIPSFLCIGEREQQFHEGQTATILKETIETCLDHIDPASPIHLVYHAPWIGGQGLASLCKTINQAYRLCKHILKDLYGEEHSISVLTTVPWVVRDFSYLRDAHSDGFCFLNLATHSDNFLRILEGIKSEAPDWLEKEVIQRDD